MPNFGKEVLSSKKNTASLPTITNCQSKETNHSVSGLKFPQKTPSSLPQPDFHRWLDNGYPPISGGQLNENEYRQGARKVIKSFLLKKWKRRKDEKELHEALNMVSQLRKKYPGLFSEVFEELLEREKEKWDKRK